MSVYVDPLCNHGWRLGPSCHLYADSLAELHAFAVSIGMRRNWFQDERVPHYDLTASKRQSAVSRGAIEHDRRKAVGFWRSKGWRSGRAN